MGMSASRIDELPGFRRRIRITPAANWVRAELEDDMHCMRVRLRHDGSRVQGVEAEMIRAPWTTCPGAPEQLRQTFTDLALAQFARRGERQSNCTHLHDLALLAAAHAQDAGTLVYDILVSDPQDGLRLAELRRNGLSVLAWQERGNCIEAPAELAGLAANQLRPWIDALDGERLEHARLLRWAAMLAHGRTIPLDRQSDAMRMPANCYSFQPARQPHARRIVDLREFSRGGTQPLEVLAG